MDLVSRNRLGKKLDSFRHILLAKISLDTPANLFERELSSSSITAESSAGADESGACGWIGG